MEYIEQKTEVANFMSRLYNKGLTTCSGGNISLFIDNNTILITPSQKDKANLKAEDIGIININGENLTPGIKMSMEAFMHLAIYNARPNVKAIIHAHPTYATSYAVAGKKINSNITDETHIILGDIAYAPYNKSGSKELAHNVAKHLLNLNVIILDKHGVLTVGETLFEAYNGIEILESAAKLNYISKKLQ